MSQLLKPNQLFRKIVALSLPFLTLLIQLRLWDDIRPFAWFLFFPTVAISAWLGGLVVGLVVTFCSIAVVWYYFLPPEHFWTPREPQYLFSAAAFALLGVVFNILSEAIRRLQFQNLHFKNLSAQSESLKNIIDSVSANIAVLDSTGTIVAVNDRWRQFGNENDRADALDDVGKKYVNFCRKSPGDPNDYAEVAAQGVKSVVIGEAKDFHFEYPCHAPHEQRWFMMNVSRLEGTLRGAVVSHVDITRRKLAELNIVSLNGDLESQVRERTAHLQASELKYRALFESSYDSILTIDSAGKIINANAQVVSKFGYGFDELIGQPVEILMPERFKISYNFSKSAYGASPNARSMGAGLDLCGRRKDGFEFPVDISLSPVMTPDGQQIHAIIRDISERKKRESQETFLATLSKRHSETRDYSDRIQNAANIVVPGLADICVLSILDGGTLDVRAIGVHDDPDSKKRFLLEKVFAAPFPTPLGGPTLFGCPRKPADEPILVQIIHLEASCHSELPPELSLEQRQCLESLGVESIVIVPLEIKGRPSGSIAFFMAESGRNFDPGDLDFFESVGSRCSVAIENARLYAEANEAIRSRELVLSIVSHDLKNPLTAIDLSAQILSGPQELASIKQKRIVDQILKSTAVMHRMITDLLDFSKAQAATFHFAGVSVSAASIVSEALETYSDRAKEDSDLSRYGAQPA